MNKIFSIFFILILISSNAFSAISNIEEEDGSPSIYPWKLKVTNGTLTDNSDGTASLTTGGGGGSGDITSVGNCLTGACADSTATDATFGNITVTSPKAAAIPIRINAHGSQSANLTEWRNSSSSTRAKITSAGGFSNTGGQSNSEIFGEGAAATAASATAFGWNASASTSSVAIGRSAVNAASSSVLIGALGSMPSGGGNVGIGYNVSTSGSNIVSIGPNSSAANSTVAIGSSATTSTTAISIGTSADSGANSVSIGGINAKGTGTEQVAIGATTSGGFYSHVYGSFSSAGSHQSSIAMGRRAAVNGSNRLVIGSSLAPMNDVYFGKGDQNTSPTAYNIRGTANTTTNGDGANIRIMGGLKDGTGTNGNLILAHNGTSAVGKVGIGMNSPTEMVTITGNVRTVGDATFTSINSTKIGNLSASDSTFNTVRVNIPSAANKGIIVKGASSQSANMQEWQNNSSTALAYVKSDGQFVGKQGNVVNPAFTSTYDTTDGLYFSDANTMGITNNGTGFIQHSTVSNDWNIITSSRSAGYFANDIAGGAYPLFSGDDGTSHKVIMTGTATQASNLQEWRNSSGTVNASVGVAGDATFSSINSTKIGSTTAADATFTNITVNSIKQPTVPSITVKVEDLAAADDDFEFFVAPESITVTDIGCHCQGTCTTTADFRLEDRSGNAMTHTTPGCSTSTSDTTFTSITASNKLVAGEGMRFDITNTPNPETDEYTVIVKTKKT